MILAIDPGTTESAYLAMDDRGVLQFFRKVNNNEMASFIEKEGDYGKLVIEEIQSFGMPLRRDVLRTARWPGNRSL